VYIIFSIDYVVKFIVVIENMLDKLSVLLVNCQNGKMCVKGDNCDNFRN